MPDAPTMPQLSLDFSPMLEREEAAALVLAILSSITESYTTKGLTPPFAYAIDHWSLEEPDMCHRLSFYIEKGHLDALIVIANELHRAATNECGQ